MKNGIEKNGVVELNKILRKNTVTETLKVVCFMLGGKKADSVFCREQSSVFQKNLEYCRKNNCPSPYRKCYRCITSGGNGNSGAVVDSKHGLCADHMIYAEDISLLKKLRKAFEEDVLPDGLKRLTVEHRQELAKSSREKYLQDRAKGKHTMLSSGKVGMIDVGRIRPRYDQPRTTSFNISSIFELSKSRKIRQVVSIIIRPIQNDPDGFEFEIIDGERRYLSALIAGINLIKSELELEEKINDKDAYLSSAVANFCKEDHTPLETLDMISRIMRDGNMSVTAVSEALGKSPTWGSMHLRLDNLETSIRKMLEEERISLTTASELGRHPKEFQIKVFKQIITDRMTATAAKMHIRCELGKAGIPIQSGKRGRRPSDDYEILKAFIKGAISKSQWLLNMGEDALKSMFVYRSKEDKEIVFAELDSLVGRIEDLKEAIS